jgi:hypothetical protein
MTRLGQPRRTATSRGQRKLRPAQRGPTTRTARPAPTARKSPSHRRTRRWQAHLWRRASRAGTSGERRQDLDGATRREPHSCRIPPAHRRPVDDEGAPREHPRQRIPMRSGGRGQRLFEGFGDVRLLRTTGRFARGSPVPDQPGRRVHPISGVRNAAVTCVHVAETRWKHTHSYPWLSSLACGTNRGATERPQRRGVWHPFWRSFS